MTSYQKMILDRLEQIAEDVKPLTFNVSLAFEWANNGRMVVTRTSSFTTIVTADFDFQTHRVQVILNNPNGPRSMMAGPRSDTVYWWSPGKPEDDVEVRRLFDRWGELIQEGLE